MYSIYFERIKVPDKNSKNSSSMDVPKETRASHISKNLVQRSLEQLVSVIIENAAPCDLMLLGSAREDDSISVRGTGFYTSELEILKDPRRLDVILMSTEEREPSSLPYKKLLMERLGDIHKWFQRWVGTQSSEIKCQIRNAISEKLELIDPYSFIPLYKFLLELLFGAKAGGYSYATLFPFTPQVSCELWKKNCPIFAEILKSLAPFDIEELSTHHIAFGGPEPLRVIIENSPFLKRVYLRNNICEELLMALEKHCPLLRVFHMEKCLGKVMVPVNSLYKMFFRGREYEEVLTIAKDCAPAERLKQLSFPHLTCVNFGRINGFKNKRESLSLFIHTLLYFYSHSIDISSDFRSPFSPALPEELPDCMRDISYNVRNWSLKGLKRWIENCKSKSEDDNQLQCNGIPQLTFPYTFETDNEIQELLEFSKIWIPKLGCKTVFMCCIRDWINPEISVYNPVFSHVGSTLTALHLKIYGCSDLQTVCDIISMCPNLELIKFKVVAVPNTEKKVNIKKLVRMKSLMIHTIESHSLPIQNFIETLVESCPELYALSMVLHKTPCQWVMSLASSKKLAGIEILSLSFHCFNQSCKERTEFLMQEQSVETPFYVYMIELLSNLKVLQLGSVPYDTLLQLKLIYEKSNLKIKIWHISPDSKGWSE